MADIPLAQRLMQSDAVKNLSLGASALMGSVEGGSLGDLVNDPQTGKFNPEVLKGSLVRTAVTSPQAQQLYDKLIESKYGQIAGAILNNPGLNVKLNRKTDVGSTIVKAYKDRMAQRQFAAAQGQAVTGMSQLVNDLAETQRKTQEKAVGYAAVEKALRDQRLIGYGKKFDPDYLLDAADRAQKAATGEGLTDEQKQFAWDALKKAYNRGFKKKGLPTVYSRKLGGIEGQRYAAATDTVSRNMNQIAVRGQMIGNTLEQANAKLDKVLSMQGPESRIKGAKVNVGKLMGNYQQLKEQQNAAEKKAAADGNVLDALSQVGFDDRPIGKTRVLVKRDLQDKGGAQMYAENLIHSQSGVTPIEAEALKYSLKRLLREQKFDDSETFQL